MKKNNVDYLVIALDPGKNLDQADVWYSLKGKGSPRSLIETCLSLFTNIYKKEDLIDVLLEYCEELDNAYGVEESVDPDIIDIIKEATQKKPRKKKNPPNEPEAPIK